MENPENQVPAAEPAPAAVPAAEPAPAAPPLDLEVVLEEYRRRQVLEHLVGPIVSVVVHVVVILCALFLLVEAPTKEVAEVEVKMEELQVKELDKKVLEELRQLEEQPAEAVPTVERPDVPQETTEVATSTDDFNDQMAQTDDAMDMSSVLDIRPTQTPLKLSALFGGRSNAGRQASLKSFGGTVAGESSVLKALRWLKDHQKPDGSWSDSQPWAMAGLGLLAFLAHGETPVSQEFGPTVQKAMQYLANTMMKYEDKDVRGAQFPYQNGIATYALSEGYGLTKIPFLKPAMERGLGFIVRGQQQRGGWDYAYSNSKLNTGPCPSGGEGGHPWDLSVSGWQMQALKAGFVAGADVPGIVESIEKSIEFLKKTSFKDGRFGYSSPGTGSAGMQGAGTLCLQLLGEGKSQEAKECLKYIAETQSVVWNDDKRGEVAAHSHPCYNWYYLTQVMFHAGTSHWSKWNEQFSAELARNQKADGHWECPPGKKVEKAEYDSVYSTTLCCLMLEVYYRYLPTYKMPKEIARGPSVLDVGSDKDLGLEIR